MPYCNCTNVQRIRFLGAICEWIYQLYWCHVYLHQFKYYISWLNIHFCIRFGYSYIWIVTTNILCVWVCGRLLSLGYNLNLFEIHNTVCLFFKNKNNNSNGQRWWIAMNIHIHTVLLKSYVLTFSFVSNSSPSLIPFSHQNILSFNSHPRFGPHNRLIHFAKVASTAHFRK